MAKMTIAKKDESEKNLQLPLIKENLINLKMKLNPIRN